MCNHYPTYKANYRACKASYRANYRACKNVITSNYVRKFNTELFKLFNPFKLFNNTIS